MSNPRLAIAQVLKAIKTAHPENTNAFMRSYLRDFRKLVHVEDNTLDSTWRGSGNAASRRQGWEVNHSCDCNVCVVYGGDCASVMRREWISEEHRNRRGVRSKISRQFRIFSGKAIRVYSRWELERRMDKFA